MIVTTDKGERVPAADPRLSQAGPAEPRAGGGPRHGGGREAGGRHEAAGGASHRRHQPRGLPLLPQVPRQPRRLCFCVLLFAMHPSSCPCSNLLHTSGPNTSPDRRWNLVLAYNQVHSRGWGAGDRVSGSILTSPHHYCCRWATLPTTTSSCLPPPPWTWWRTGRWSPGAGTSQPLTRASSGTSRTTQQRICDSYFESIEYLNYSLSGNNLHDHDSLISNLINNFVF